MGSLVPPVTYAETMFARVDGPVRLADKVADVLAEEIRTGRLSEGDKLPTEVQLVDQLGVSRTVVREAVSRLRSAGMVEARQGLGVFVKAPVPEALAFAPESVATRDKVIQIVEVRKALEADAAALAATRATPADVDAIRAGARAIDEAVAAGRDGVVEDVAFHQAIAEVTGNPFMVATLKYLGTFTFAAIRVTRANESRRKDFADQVRAEHAAVIEAIAAGDAKRARSAARAHMKNAARRLQDADAEFWKAPVSQPPIDTPG